MYQKQAHAAIFLVKPSSHCAWGHNDNTSPYCRKPPALGVAPVDGLHACRRLIRLALAAVQRMEREGPYPFTHSVYCRKPSALGAPR